jgi:hypothetical protein
MQSAVSVFECERFALTFFSGKDGIICAYRSIEILLTPNSLSSVIT